MSNVLAVAKKELRTYFRSPIAIIFLGVYLLFTLVTFFGVEQFFARNIADLRPLFAWLPVLLALLCSALTMRQWSEEQKLGTLEVLLTLPVRLRDFVLGKFLASLALVSVALLLTLPVPVMVAMNGDLDWGPVIGGYVGAVLLAAAYLSIGLFISCLTDNQIVALIVSVVVSGLFWLVGSDQVQQFFGNETAELLAAIGTGSRFESIRRGVFDIRDLVYYASLVAAFLTMNTVFLEAKGWSDGQRTRGHRTSAQTTVGLVVANALAINVVLSGVTALRLDLTERGEYSISPVTKNLVRSLPEPLLIRGYFSEKTHPLLAPMVPRIRDVIEEYGIIGGDTIRTEYVDPRNDEDVEKEANQTFGIKSFPFRIADARDQAVVNSYFSILVKYGDQFEVLNFDDIIEVQGTTMQSVEVKLRNIEYDLTSAIKKVAFGFQTLDAVFAKLAEPAEFTAFITPASLPDNFKEVPDKVKKVLEEMKKEANGKFTWKVVNPDEDKEWTRQKLFQTYGFKPFAVSLLSQDTFYLHLLLKMGDRYERVFPAESLSEADIKKEITAALKRGAPGFLKTVGIAKPETPDYSNLPPQLRAQMPPPPPDLSRALRQQLSETYTVRELDLKDGRVPGDIDVLLVYGPKDYDAKQAFAIDQHLMRGGTVVILGGRYELDPSGGQGIGVAKVTTGLEDTLAAYGLRIEEALVMDPQNEPIPVPVERDLGGLRVREIQYVKYPFFVDVRPNGMASDSPVVAGLNSVTVPWASPIVVTPPEKKEGEDAVDRAYTNLLVSSANAWTKTDTDVQPNLKKYPELGFEVGTDRKSRVLAVLATGTFESAFKGKGAPEGVSASVVERSPATGRLVVVGSSAFGSDVLLQLSQQAQSNLQLAQNLVDWGLEDTDLLSIRSRGTFARTLMPLERSTTNTLIIVTSGVCLLGLALITLATVLRQRTLRPIDLDPAKRQAPAGRPQEARS